MNCARLPILRPWAIASTQGWISSPARRPTIVAPRIRRAAIEQDLDEALGRALGLRAVVVGERPDQPLDLDALVPGHGLGQSDLGEFGLGVGDPGHRPGRRPWPAA